MYSRLQNTGGQQQNLTVGLKNLFTFISVQRSKYRKIICEYCVMVLHYLTPGKKLLPNNEHMCAEPGYNENVITETDDFLTAHHELTIY